MRCCSCGADIPPQWTHSITQNLCPGCGGPIMTDESKELMDELAGAFARMPNDPQGLAGWLLSNYRFKKIGSAEPTEHFHRAGGGQRSQYDESVPLKIAPGYDAYLSRAEVKPPSPTVLAVKNAKSAKLAEMASAVNSMPDPYGDFSTNDISPDGSGGSSEADLADYNAMLAQGIDPFVGGQLSLQSLVKSSSNAGALSPQQILAMRRQSGYDPSYDDNEESIGRSTVGVGDDVLTAEEKELMKTPDGAKFVIANRNKRIKAQDALSGGGGGGGSFSRA